MVTDFLNKDSYIEVNITLEVSVCQVRHKDQNYNLKYGK